MATFIKFIIGEFPIIMTLVALLLGVIHIFMRSNRSIPDIFLGYLFFFAVGLTGLWGFVFHAFFPQMAAAFIGWANSPFQFEVAVANLGLGVVGIFGLRASQSYRIAGALFTACFLWGAAFGHIVQMLKLHNFAPGNAGLIFYNDLLLPLLLTVFLLVSRDR
jgi:hypothetical protein